MKLLTSLFLTFICLNISSLGQGAVSERPIYPQHSRVLQNCKKGAIWIKGEWKWEESSQSYIWQDGHCEKCPRNKTYLPGGWTRKNGSWVWVPGTWKKISNNGFREP